MRASMLGLVVVVALVFVLVPALGQQPAAEIADIEPGASAEIAFTGVDKPVDIDFGPDGTLYYAEFDTGNLRAIPPGAAAPTDPLWTAPNLQLGGERGFVGLGVAPDFATTREFYVFYQTNKTTTAVSRLSRIVDGQEEVLMDDIMSGPLHNSGRIAFHPDGTLLLSVGDAVLDTAGRHKSMHAHDPASLNGKVLRLDRDGDAAAGNAWGNEVWTKGHRNVYGLAVSPAGVVLATENGPDHWDEINLLQGGEDYGWPTCAGACDDEQYADPILAYESTIAPTGAVWYDGHFYFSDFNKGTVHRVRLDAEGRYHDDKVLKFSSPRILDIAVGPSTNCGSSGSSAAACGPDGLYISSWDSIWRLVPAEVSSVEVAPIVAPTTEIVAEPSPSPSLSPSPSPEENGARAADIPHIGVFAYALVALAALLRGRR